MSRPGFSPNSNANGNRNANKNASDAVRRVQNAINAVQFATFPSAVERLFSAAVAPIQVIGERGTPIGQTINTVKIAVFYRS